MKSTTFFYLLLLSLFFASFKSEDFQKTKSQTNVLNSSNLKFILDANKSSVSWRGYEFVKSNLSSHNGIAKLKEGEVVINSSTKSIISGKAVVDMNSFESFDLNKKPTLKAKLDNHLKGDKFFDVEKFPTAIFQVIGYKKLEKKKYNALITGNLTMKGVTKNISFKATVKGDLNKIELKSEEFDIDRQDWGVVLKDYGESTTKDVVTMQINLVAIQPK